MFSLSALVDVVMISGALEAASILDRVEKGHVVIVAIMYG